MTTTSSIRRKSLRPAPWLPEIRESVATKKRRVAAAAMKMGELWIFMMKAKYELTLDGVDRNYVLEFAFLRVNLVLL